MGHPAEKTCSPPQSPPWLVYNDEEDLAFKSMVLIRGEEYDATAEIRRIKENLQLHKNDLHALLCTQEGQQPHYRSVAPIHGGLAQVQVPCPMCK